MCFKQKNILIVLQKIFKGTLKQTLLVTYYIMLNIIKYEHFKNVKFIGMLAEGESILSI